MSLKRKFLQPHEQGGFRSGFNTCDHLHVLRSLLQKCNEYNIKTHVAFIDYEASNTGKMWATLTSMNKCEIDSRYKTLLKNVHKQAKTNIKLFGETTYIPTQRGVRQKKRISD